MIENHRILSQFSIPKRPPDPYMVTWARAQDLFGDRFTLQAVIDDERIEFQYLHAPTGSEQPKCVWSFSIGRTAKGRARIERSDNIAPPLHTIERAREIIASTHRQLQANPEIGAPKISAASLIDMRQSRRPPSKA